MRPVVVLHSRQPRCLSRFALLAMLILSACTADSTGLDREADRTTRLTAAALIGTPRVRISQVYGGGGNTGAPFQNDFIELYNSGTAPQLLTGWSVQYASATGTGNFSANSVVALTGTLPPGQYYLVGLAGGAVGSALPTTDATGAISMSGTAGKAVLVKATTGLACNGGSAPCSVAQRALIEDLVGYGSANFFEGFSAAPAASNTLAALRKGAGATDTDNNGADFETGTPTPRNLASGPPFVQSTSPSDGASAVALAGNITVTFSRAVTVADPWFSIACTSGSRTATVTGGPTIFTLDPDGSFQAGDSCTVTITAARVTEQVAPNRPMVADYTWSFSAGDPASCAAPFTAAFAIQGAGSTSPLLGQIVTTSGVVVGDFEGAAALRGFYVQDQNGDGNTATSDGVFVFNASNDDVRVGDVVRVTGTVSEFQEQTQVNSSAVLACGTGTVSPQTVSLPASSVTDLERFEGMLVRIPQALTVTEHFQLGRFGQVVLSSGGRLAQPTNVVTPGAAALALQAQNDLRRITIDDADQRQNPDPILFGRGGNPLSAINTLRGGDEVSNLTGVMTYGWGGSSASPNTWRVRPFGALSAGVPLFVATNARPMTVSVSGSLRVAAMNVLNYYNTFSGCTNGVGGVTDACRGANSSIEFVRQRAKTIAGILALGSDVIGLNEIENDGYGSTSAIADLVDGLNAAGGPGVWSFIDADASTGAVNALGTDGIKVALLFRTDRVTPVGRTAVLNSTAFVNGGDPSPRSRPALAQAFQQPNRARVVVVVNHFKSKGSACVAPDAGDGQGNCNQVRVNAAMRLREWLAADPTDIGESRTLIMGDLNSYAKEDPITALLGGGYTNLADTFLGAGSYSYAFNGQWGSLDHALGSASLTNQVAGMVKHHVNADEPPVLDYNVESKSDAQIAALYAPDQYRSSDHDPVVIGLNLVAPAVTFHWGGFLLPTQTLPTLNDDQAGSTIRVRFSLSGASSFPIFVPGSPLMRQVNCGTLAPLEALVSARQGTNTLRPEVTRWPQPVVGLLSAQSVAPLAHAGDESGYNYLWSTDEAWAGSCRELVLRFIDGSQQSAVFRFR